MTRVAAAGLVAVLTAGIVGAGAQAAPTAAAVKAGEYLVRTQAASGSWAGASRADEVADAVVALVAAGVTDASLTKAVTYVADNAPMDADRAAATARVVLAAVAARRNPRDFGKVDYVGRLRTYYNPNTGAYDPSTEPNALTILAFVAAKEAIPAKAITGLQGRQCTDGGFPRATCLLGTNATSTALALNALAAAGVGTSDPVVEKARTFLLSAQNADGGFGESGGQPTAAIPTSQVVSLLVAMDEDPAAAPWLKSPGANPVSALGKLQEPGGGLRANPTTPADPPTTARVLPALALLALPVLPEDAAPPATTTTAASPSPAPASTTTTRRPLSGTGRGSVTTIAPAVSTPGTAPDPGRTLAAPAARNDGDSGRSLTRLLPFVVTLFGAGALGIFLRRRARI